MSYVDPFPVELPSSTDPANFDERADAFYGHLPTFVDQMNALPPIVAAAAGTSVMAFKFKVATSGDPGAGGVLLNNAAQRDATGCNLDLLDALGNDVSGRTARFGAGTSVVKGELVFTKVGDGRVWLSFEVTSGTSPTGFRALVLANGVGSSISPFSAEDDLAVSYVAAGDEGAQGPTSLWTNVLSGGSIASQTLVTLSPLPSGYADLRFQVYATSGGSPDFQVAFSADGSTFSSLRTLFSMGATAFASITVRDYKSDRPQVEAAWSVDAPGSSPDAQGNSTAGMSVRVDGGISALRFSIGGGFLAGSTLYQPRAR